MDECDSCGQPILPLGLRSWPGQVCAACLTDELAALDGREQKEGETK